MISFSSEFLAENTARFSSRFPELAQLCSLDKSERAMQLLESLGPDVRLEQCRNGEATLAVGPRYLHSRYDPAAEAEKILKSSASFSGDGCLFCGIGLGFLPELYALRYPEAPLVIVEPEPAFLAAAFAARPLDRLFAHRNLMIICGTEPLSIPPILERTGLDDIRIYAQPSITFVHAEWFEQLERAFGRSREKKQINQNTLKRFGDLWLRNMSRNLGELERRGGILPFSRLLDGIPVLLLAAGPSLDEIIPVLGELRKHCAVIAVDTSVRACARAGIEPDFIVLADPQYWNWRHFDGQSCPSSILVTELAAWPAVFRFVCSGIYLFSSRFPLAHFLEKRMGVQGELGAGGSVATTAWDFAAFLGASEIYAAGLDLGFPDRKTHFSGSIFEERTHTVSTRLDTAETAGYRALYGAGPYPVPDYRGGTVLTDKRLSLYAWWFESALAKPNAPPTWTLAPKGMKIEGILPAEAGQLASKSELRSEIERRLSAFRRGGTRQQPASGEFGKALKELIEALEDIERIAGRAAAICARKRPEAGAERRKAERDIVAELDRIDRQLLSHPAKELAAMIFDRFRDNGNSLADPIEESRLVYAAIQEAARRNLDLVGTSKKNKEDAQQR